MHVRYLSHVIDAIRKMSVIATLIVTVVDHLREVYQLVVHHVMVTWMREELE